MFYLITLILFNSVNYLLKQLFNVFSLLFTIIIRNIFNFFSILLGNYNIHKFHELFLLYFSLKAAIVFFGSVEYF